MRQTVIYVGIDVDDVRYHGSALDRCMGEVLDFRCRPTLKGLVQQFEKAHEYFGDVQLKLCYEASYVGSVALCSRTIEVEAKMKLVGNVALVTEVDPNDWTVGQQI